MRLQVREGRRTGTSLLWLLNAAILCVLSFGAPDGCSGGTVTVDTAAFDEESWQDPSDADLLDDEIGGDWGHPGVPRLGKVPRRAPLPFAARVSALEPVADLDARHDAMRAATQQVTTPEGAQ